MMLFWKAGLAMLALPKTGTHAYEAALRDQADVVFAHPPQLKHVTARSFRHKIRPLVDPQKERHFKLIAVVREPVAWLGSWYRYRGRPYLDGSARSTKGISFDNFVSAYLQPEPPEFARVGHPSHFVSNARGEVIVDYLFCYENLSPLTDFLSSRLKCDVSPEVMNPSPAADLSLSSETALHLRDKCSAEFDLHHAVHSGVFLPHG